MNQESIHNTPVADWAQRHIRERVELRVRFGSRRGRIFAYALLSFAPGSFIALGLLLFAVGAGSDSGAGSLLFFGLLMAIPCTLMAVVAARVRANFVTSLDGEGVRGSFGQRFPWSDLRSVDHVSKVVRLGGVRRRIPDNQIELVFEGGRLVIPPMIREREAVWALVDRLPAQVMDDGVPRDGREAVSGA